MVVYLGLQQLRHILAHHSAGLRVIFPAQISSPERWSGGCWEEEGEAGLSDNVINGVCFPGNSGGGGGHRLTDARAVIWARGGSGKDTRRDGWAVTHQAWGLRTAGYANEGMAGILMEE